MEISAALLKKIAETLFAVKTVKTASITHEGLRITACRFMVGDAETVKIHITEV